MSLYFTSLARHRLSILSEGWDWLTTFVPYGDLFRKHRAYQHRFIDSPDTLKVLDVQLSETHAMLKGILDSPDDYATHVNR